MNRPYPLLVKPEEEEAVRNAAKLINERIKLFKEQFSVHDTLDLVVMCCLELATDNVRQNDQNRSFLQSAEAKLNALNDAINSSILNTEEVPRVG